MSQVLQAHANDRHQGLTDGCLWPVMEDADLIVPSVADKM